MTTDTTFPRWKEQLDENYQWTVRRAIELYLSCDLQLRDLSRFWEMYAGQHRTLIKQRLAELGFEKNDEKLVEDLFHMLGSDSARQSKQQSVDTVTERRLFETYEQRNKTSQLRCELCGYHFSRPDLSAPRRLIAENSGLTLADFIEPRRREDDFKPIGKTGNDRDFLRLEIDHVIPRLGLGGTTLCNLQVLCAFCNAGKTHYRYAGEMAAECISASASHLFRTTESITWLSRGFVAAVSNADRRSMHSRLSYNQTELSVRFKPNTESHWLVPWNFIVVSYDD